MYRSHTCNDLNKTHEGQSIVLSGWVHRRRDHGGVIFVDLRDRYGVTQIVSDPEKYAEAHELLNGVRSEYVLKIEGEVMLRPDGQKNDRIDTGEIEVVVKSVEVLNESLTPPFEIDQDKDVNEEMRLTYRYLDLRRDRLKRNIVMRHEIVRHIRDYMSNNDFIEVETPILIKGTPEGSREYLVPARLHPGNFYVLPQSPQQLKQLLMVSGFDRYFQIARCFRDEDQRGDRQPEFTQLDMEMSFVEEEDVRELNEKLLIELLEKFCPGKKLKETPFPVMSYQEAMDNYGIDKPDLRFDLKLQDVSDIVKDAEFSVFANAVKDGGVVKALRVPGGSEFSRKDIDELTEVAKIYKAKGLAYIVVEKDEQTGGLAAVHHPFTAPVDVDTFVNDPENALSKGYDLVLDGNEIGGGSIRIHNESVQKRVFEALGISEEDAERRFGHMLKAFRYGAPPHGGIAWGIDRLVMIFAGEPNIREVIAFPKDQKAKDLMLGAPSQMPDDQVEELHIKVNVEEEE